MLPMHDSNSAMMTRLQEPLITSRLAVVQLLHEGPEGLELPLQPLRVHLVQQGRQLSASQRNGPSLALITGIPLQDRWQACLGHSGSSRFA